VCDLENLKNEEAMTRVGSQHHRKKSEGKRLRGKHRSRWEDNNKVDLQFIRRDIVD
jgi:transposase-like protein